MIQTKTLPQRDLFRSQLQSSNRLVTTSEMEKFANLVCEYPLVLGKYLNMLSLLEFVGARALINTFANQKENNGTNLLHVLEEARHAMSLRKMGEKLSKQQLEYHEDTVFSNLSSNYFIKRMIAYVHNDLLKDAELFADQDKRHRFVILYVSGILEVRAVWWYTIFNSAIEKKKYNINFNKVLADEEGHITSIETEISASDPKHASRLEQYFGKEEELFARFYRDQVTYFTHATSHNAAL